MDDDQIILLYQFQDEDDEAPGERVDYIGYLSKISHFYWDEDGKCVKVPRRVHQEDYWDDNSSRFENTFDEVHSELGLVELRRNVWVPVKNILEVQAIKRGVSVNIGDFHLVETKKPMADLLKEIRNVYQRVYGNENQQTLDFLNRAIDEHGGTPFLPGF